MYTLSKFEEDLCKDIVDCAYLVHTQLGPGLLEKIYETCFCHELSKKLIRFQRQAPVPIYYDGIRFEDGFKMDVLVEDLIVCEFKCVDEIHPVHRAQLLTYLKLTTINIGFLINFNVVLIKHGIRRICLE